MLVEGFGNDLVFGGDGDTLTGGGGKDTLDSGGGNDRLLGGGGKGAVYFVFEAGDGKDRLTDFKTAQETLALVVAFYTFGDSIAEFLS